MLLVRLAALVIAVPLVLAVVAGGAARADKIDDVIQAEMAKRKVVGLSLAVIQGGKIVKARGYGTIGGGSGGAGGAGGATPVTTDTLFQAGSISKSVSALGALRLVERGQLSLDEDVNARLKGWKLPDSDATVDRKVTVRGILSHTAGLTVHGFPGYAAGKPVPTLVQVLDGTPPANTPAIRVDVAPGSLWRYSGGGYTVLQELMGDVTGKPFPGLLRTLVLAPIGMSHSSFQQPLPPERAALTATGHLADRSAVEGRWHVYPEMAAAGLWTTPSDLARFAMEIQRTLAGANAAALRRTLRVRQQQPLEAGRARREAVHPERRAHRRRAGAGRARQLPHRRRRSRAQLHRGRGRRARVLLAARRQERHRAARGPAGGGAHPARRS